MLISLTDLKNSLGITGSTYDSFLVEQEEIISQSVEGYCGRKFLVGNYVQTFYGEDYLDSDNSSLQLFHYPVVGNLTSIELDTVDISADVRVHKETSTLLSNSGFFQYGYGELIVEYTAGLATLPAPVASVITSLVEERYNKKLNGVSLNFGSDVQSISIPGTISVAFDYSLQSNDRKIAYGTILGNYVNVLDAYRSDRRIVGSGKMAFVEAQ